MTSVKAAVDAIPGSTQDALIARIGTSDGQVLKPIKDLVDDVSAAANAKITEIRNLLSEEIDPTRSTSTIFRALQKVKELLDPVREDSIQGCLNRAIGKVCAGDGEISRAVKAAVGDAVAPLVTQVTNLTNDFTGKKAADAALSNTTLKGTPYEAEIVERLQPWAKCVGAEVVHVGGDNTPGDITVRLTEFADPTSTLLIVLEVRDRKDPNGRRAVSQEVSTAMENRGAIAAVYLSRCLDGLAKDLGEWAEGVCNRGPWVACTDKHLITAIRFLFVQWCVQKRTLAPALDASAAVSQIKRIRTTLDRIKNIKTNATAVQNGAIAISLEADLLRDEVRDSLCNIEDSLGIVPRSIVKGPAQ